MLACKLNERCCLGYEHTGECVEVGEVQSLKWKCYLDGCPLSFHHARVLVDHLMLVHMVEPQLRSH